MDLQPLVSTLDGRVILPADADYDTARQVFYGGIDKRPAAIIRVAGSADVARAVLFARERHIPFAVRSGGHSVAGYSTIDGGLVIDLHDLRDMEVDAAQKTAWAGSGLSAVDLTTELDKHSLAVGFGDTGSVGIGGITLGGGVGYLARKFGLAIDNLLAAEIVTANGDILRIDSENHPDLFWAIRGGGGNFGIVTKFQYRLHPLSECYGGMLLLPATPAVIAGFTVLAQAAPDELSAIVNIMPTPPMPFIPKELHGKLAVMALLVYAGDAAEGEQAVKPFRDLAKPLADMIKPMRYKDIFPPEDGHYHPTALSSTLYLQRIDQAVATDILAWLDKSDAPMRALQFRVLGGAVARVPAGATAYAHRQNPIMANIAIFYTAEAEKAARQQWVDGFAQVLDQGDNAGYVGFLGPTEQDRLTDAYPPDTLEKLRQVKRAYDPGNLFKLNFNIPPAS